MRREGRMVRSRLLNERRFSAHWVYSALSSALYQPTLTCFHFSVFPFPFFGLLFLIFSHLALSALYQPINHHLLSTE